MGKTYRAYDKDNNHQQSKKKEQENLNRWVKKPKKSYRWGRSISIDSAETAQDSFIRGFNSRYDSDYGKE